MKYFLSGQKPDVKIKNQHLISIHLVPLQLRNVFKQDNEKAAEKKTAGGLSDHAGTMHGQLISSARRGGYVGMDPEKAEHTSSGQSVAVQLPGDHSRG